MGKELYMGGMELHQILFNYAQDIIFYTNENGDILDANQNAVAKYNYQLKELKKLNLSDLRHPSTHPLLWSQMKAADEAGITFECIHVRKDGTSFPVEASVKGVLIDDSKLRIHIVRDISERKKTEQSLLYHANYDFLTGIPNRGFLMKQLSSTLENARRGNFKFALMLFDIDKFKDFNDSHGHIIGDEALRATASVVQNTIRKVDFVARIGGDEFVIIQPYIRDKDDASVLARRILEQLKAPFKLNNISLTINLSIGVSIYPDDSTDAEDLISFADRAMYASKQAGDTSFVFYSNLKV